MPPDLSQRARWPQPVARACPLLEAAAWESERPKGSMREACPHLVSGSHCQPGLSPSGCVPCGSPGPSRDPALHLKGSLASRGPGGGV